jgi:hypothetical protein
MENKICPVLSTAKHLSETMGINNGLVLCEKEACAWYDINNKSCILNALSCLAGIGFNNG